MEIDSSSSTCSWFDLKLDRNLLDANFDGYKLSLDSFTQYKLDLAQSNNSVDTFNLINGEYNHRLVVYQHLKLFSLQNLLFTNAFNDSFVYYFDSELRLTRINYRLPAALMSIRQLVRTNFQLENKEKLKSASVIIDRVSVTMRFVSEHLAVVFDGYETLYVCDKSQKSNDDLTDETWTVLFKHQQHQQQADESSISSSIIKDAILSESSSSGEENKLQIHVLLMNIHENVNATNKDAKFETMIHWLTLDSSDSINWNISRQRRLNAFNYVPEYVSLETNGSSINIIGTSLIRFVYDSETGGKLTLEKQQPEQTYSNLSIGSTMVTSEANDNDDLPMYNWNQTDSEVNLNLMTVVEITKNDLLVEIKPNHLSVTVNEKRLFSTELYSTIKTEESTWTLSNKNTIEFTLFKANTNFWTSFMFCKREETEISDQPAPEPASVTAEKNENNNTLFSLDQQLEECDGILDSQMMSNEDEEKLLMLRRLDGHSHVATHKCFVNENKFLFDVKSRGGHKAAAFCLRHDVDGVLWQPHRVSAPSAANTVWLTHEHTFLAYGYVQASKQDAKFRSCSPDHSYVCVCDTQKHVYVYKQQADIFQQLNLRNRKTGKTLNQIAKQFLISLDTDKEILGIYCANDYLLVLVYNCCYIFKV